MRGLETLEARRLLSFSGLSPATITGDGYESVDRILGMSDGGYVAAGLFRKTKFAASGKVRTAPDESDAFIVRVDANGGVRWTRTLSSDWDTELRSRGDDDDRIDFAARPGRAGEPFTQGVSDQPQKPGEFVSSLAVAPDGSIVVGGSFLGKLDFGYGAGTFEPEDREFYDGFVLRLDDATGMSQRVFTLGGRFNEIVTDVKVDTQNSVFVAGSFERGTDFNPGRAQFIIEPLGRGDGFIAKFSPRDKFIWMAPIGSETAVRTEVESVNSIALDAAGNVYASGSFAYITDFDPGAGRHELRAEDLTDAFTARYDGTTGALGWVVAQGGEEYDGGRAVAVSSEGVVYSAGYFQKDAKLDPNQPDFNFMERSDESTRAGTRSDLFFTRFNADGVVRWVRQLGGPDYELIGGLSVTASGNLVIAGSYTDNMDFDPSRRSMRLQTPVGDEISDANEGDRDRAYSAFVATYSPRGIFVSVHQIDGKFHEDVFASGLSMRAGNIVPLLAGRYRGGLTSAQLPLLDVITSSDPRGREDGYVLSIGDPIF